MGCGHWIGKATRGLVGGVRRIGLLRRSWARLALGTWLATGTSLAASLEDVKPYLRSVKGAQGSSTLEVAMRRMAREDGEGPTLWLVGVTHLGTHRYYQDLQRFLDGCSLVLFEAVRADDEGRPGRSEGFSLQAELARALGLTFQLDEINYDRGHFQNSDLQLEQIARILGNQTNLVDTAAASDETAPVEGAVEFGALVQAMSGEGLVGGLARLGVSLLAASTRLQAATKLAMIEMLSQLPNDLAGIAGLPAGMQRLLRVLIEERNRAVVLDVQRAIESRTSRDSVAVFYGAGHMPDLEHRFNRELGYRPVEDRWLVAFDVDPRAMGISEFEVALTTRLVRAQLAGLERRQPAASAPNPAPPTSPDPPAEPRPQP